MKLNLVVLTPGKQEGKSIPITLTQFLIGRDPQCQLRPASPAISKRHCALLVKNGKVFVRDFDSMNGTFVNEEQIKGEVEIKNNDTLKVGPLHFTVKIEASPAPTAPKPALPEGSPTPPTVRIDAPAKQTAAPTAKTADDDIAAMLLSLQDDEDTRAPGAGGEIPEGSTVMDIVVPPELGTGDTATNHEASKDKMSQAKQAQASTSTAAKAILEKYMKRPR